MSALLEVRALKTFFQVDGGEFPAVDGISFSIDAGRTLGIVGESGCGKSVTALSIMGLVPQPPGRMAGGEIVFDGVDLLQLSPPALRDLRGDRISMIFQEPMTSLNPVLTVGEQIVEGILRHRPMSRDAARDRAIEMLRMVHIPSPEERFDDHPYRLSGGMRQRVMIAMALSCKPKLLIADEPTTALDVTIQAQILDLMRTLRAETGTAIILITHDLGVVAELADDVARDVRGPHRRARERRRIVRRAAASLHGGSARLDPQARRRAGPACRDRGPGAEPARAGRRLLLSSALPVRDRALPSRRSAASRSRQRAPVGVLARSALRRHGGTEMIPASGGALLRVDKLVKHFPVKKGIFGRSAGAVQAVDGVSFELGAGETLALVGESGCGKSTTGRLLLRLIEPTSGKVWFEGADLYALDAEAMRAKRRSMQIIFQDPYASLNPRMTVRQTLAEPLALYGLAPGREKERIAELLGLVGLAAQHAQRYPHEFSGGQRQRIGIARALAVEPAPHRLRRAGVRARCLDPGAGHQSAHGSATAPRAVVRLYRPTTWRW